MNQKTLNLTDGNSKHFTVHLLWNDEKTRFHCIAEYRDDDDPPKKQEYGEGYEDNYAYTHEHMGYSTLCLTDKNPGYAQSFLPEIKEAMYAAYTGTTRPRRESYKTEKKYKEAASHWSGCARVFGMEHRDNTPYKLLFVAPEWKWAFGWMGMYVDRYGSFYIEDQTKWVEKIFGAGTAV